MEAFLPYYTKHIIICVNARPQPQASCGPSGGEEIYHSLKALVAERGLRQKVRVSRSLCQDLCSHGPVVSVYPENIVYRRVRPEDVSRIVETHLSGL